MYVKDSGSVVSFIVLNVDDILVIETVFHLDYEGSRRGNMHSWNKDLHG